SGVGLNAAVALGVLFLVFFLVLATVIVLCPFSLLEEALPRRTDEAGLGFRTASIGIVSGDGCLFLSTTIRPVIPPTSSPPRNSKINGSMVCFSPYAK